MAERIYIEPLLPDVVERILELEKPDALLAGMGGQTALNIASALAHDGSLDELEVELIGCDLLTISPDLLEEMQNDHEQVSVKLTEEQAVAATIEKIEIDENSFRFLLNEDPMATEKLAEVVAFNKKVASANTSIEGFEKQRDAAGAVLKKLVAEMAALFDDDVFHLGAISLPRHVIPLFSLCCA